MQAAFREHHGLQCGYCTPGMVMAAVSLRRSPARSTEDEVRKGLEGNLCRCTGYHNIVQAVAGAAGASCAGSGAVIPAAFDYVRADSADEAVALARRARRRRQAARRRAVAAAADEAAARDAVGARRRRPAPDLSYVRDAGDHVAIGALTRHRDLEHDAVLRRARAAARRRGR